MNTNYWNVAKYGFALLILILAVALITKARMLFVVFDLVALLITLLVLALGAVDLISFWNKRLNDAEKAKKDEKPLSNG
jgi:hypothetical protein